MLWPKIRSDFDVTMRSFDGAETCELVGLFLLSQLTHLDVNVGLYRDDGLATCTKTPKEVEAIKKKCAKYSNATACKSLLKPIKSCRLPRYHIGSENRNL